MRENRVCEVETRAMVKERKENDTRQEKNDMEKEKIVVKPMDVSRKTRMRSWKMELVHKKR